MTTHTRFLQDILRQPAEMARTIDYLVGPGQDALQEASSLVRSTRHVFIPGIGASWHVAMSAASLLHLPGHPVYVQEPGELLHFTDIPPGSVVVAISRTGRSIEIVQLLAKAQASDATVIGITNSANSPLALESAIAVVIPAKLDHAYFSKRLLNPFDCCRCVDEFRYDRLCFCRAFLVVRSKRCRAVPGVVATPTARVQVACR